MALAYRCAELGPELGLIQMAHKLNLLTVAEGVETKAQFQFLREKDCDMAQGFLFSEALHAEEFASLLREEADGFALNSA